MNRAPRMGERRENDRKVDPRTLEMLVCPLTKTRLTLSANGLELISTVARMAFPIRQGVPMLALDEARTVDEAEIEILRKRGD